MNAQLTEAIISPVAVAFLKPIAAKIDAELVVSMAAAVATFLVGRHDVLILNVSSASFIPELTINVLKPQACCSACRPHPITAVSCAGACRRTHLVRDGTRRP